MAREILVCAPACDALLIPGTIVIAATCGHRVAVAPSSQRLISELSPETICIACVIALRLPSADLRTTPGSLEEIEALEGEAFRAQVERRLGEVGFTFQG